MNPKVDSGEFQRISKQKTTMEMQNFSRWPPRPQIEETRYINGTQEHAVEKPPAVPDPGEYPCDDTISTESPPSYDFEPRM